MVWLISDVPELGAVPTIYNENTHLPITFKLHIHHQRTQYTNSISTYTHIIANSRHIKPRSFMEWSGGYEAGGIANSPTIVCISFLQFFNNVFRYLKENFSTDAAMNLPVTTSKKYTTTAVHNSVEWLSLIQHNTDIVHSNITFRRGSLPLAFLLCCTIS